MTEDTGLLWQRQGEAEQGVWKGPSKCHLSLITPAAPSKGWAWLTPGAFGNQKGD